MPRLFRKNGNVIRNKLEKLKEKENVNYENFLKIWKKGLLNDSQMTLLINSELYVKNNDTQDIYSEFMEEEIKKRGSQNNDEIFLQDQSQNYYPKTPNNTQNQNSQFQKNEFENFDFLKKKRIYNWK